LYKPKRSKLTILYLILLIIGFCFMEFPGVFFFKDKIDPYIFGFPFIYGYIIIWWIYMCVIMLIAFLTNWGFKKEGGDES
jgi:hypothetical protein